MADMVASLVASLTPRMEVAIKGAAKNSTGGIGRRNLGRGGGTHGALARRGLIAPREDGWFALTEAGWSVAEALGVDVPKAPVSETPARDEWFATMCTADGQEHREDVDQEAVVAACENADDTSVERGFSDASEEWYTVALATYHMMRVELANERQAEADLAAQDDEQAHMEEEPVETQELTTPKGIRFAKGEAGREAADAYVNLMADRMAVPAVDIRKGDHIRPEPNGLWFRVTADAHQSRMRGHVFIRSGRYLFTRPAGSKVVRHNKEAQLQVMRDVADQYPGAELEFPEVQEEAVEPTPVTVTITRHKLYPEVARPGPAWRWSYNYRVDGGPVCQYGPGLVSLRDMLRFKFRDVRIVETWQKAQKRTVVTLRDNEGYRFRLEVATEGSGALVTASDWEPGAEDPEVTTTRFATTEEASAFVKETVEALVADGYKEVAQ
ncbi:hypothetical protein [Streptomyces ardesiacus]|nr:hypothetical protein [Streptomyces ardesiacus]